MPETHTSGVRIRYDDLSRGEPALLFIPGWCCNRAFFHQLVPRLGARRRVLAVDLRGHGQSGGSSDFSRESMVDDLVAVIEASGASQVVPVALSHAGWWAIDLRRRLGSRIPGLVLLDWLVLDPPPPFLGVLQALQSPQWQQAREALFNQWLQGAKSQEVRPFVLQDMGSFGQETWAQAGRRIAEAYEKEGSPLRALEHLVPPVPTLHLYAQPADAAWLAAQQAYAADHPWFQVEKLRATSHFPLLEVPDEVAARIEPFVASLTQSQAAHP